MKRRKMLALVAAVLIALQSMALAETWRWVEEPTPAQELRLTGIRIGIDPGHQAHQNTQQERVSPNSSEMKAKVSSGTAGVRTGAPEYQVNLEISLKLREVLESMGCEVYMTRETNDVDISNQERALMMNEYGVDLVLRLHCNGAENSGTNGIGLYVNATGDIAEPSYAAAEQLLPAMVSATGARADGIFRRDTYTGLNWSTVPCILVEMGYMSNPEEDERLSDADYQQKMAEGIAEGICAYFQR